MGVAPGDFEGATSRVLRAPRRFDQLGVRGPDAVRGRFEERVLFGLLEDGLASDALEALGHAVEEAENAS